ncbi:hypothetical protein NDI39_31100 [Microcoleus sp. ZQ-A2]|nr:hypothetical protein [Microcoleus sp. FACHB-1]
MLQKFSSTIQSNIRLSFDFKSGFAAGNLSDPSNFPVGFPLREKKVFGWEGWEGEGDRKIKPDPTLTQHQQHGCDRASLT